MPRGGGGQDEGNVKLYQHYGRAPFWRAAEKLLHREGAVLARAESAVLARLLDGQTWIQEVPESLLHSYRLQYRLLSTSISDDDEAIERDVLRTVRSQIKGTGLLLDRSPEQKSALALAMHRVLNAAATVDHMGYCQGQNYIVDVLLKAGICEEDAFCLFLHALRHLSLFGIFRTDVPILTEYLAAFDSLLAAHAPDLAAHLDHENFGSSVYAIEWISTLFALSARPLLTLAVLDLFFFNCRDAMLRVALAIMLAAREQLLDMDQEALLSRFRDVAAGVDEVEVVATALALDMGKGLNLMDGRNFGSGATTLAAADGGSSDRRASLLLLRNANGGAAAASSSSSSLLFRLAAAHANAGKTREASTGELQLLAGRQGLREAALAVTRRLGWDALEAAWFTECALHCGSDWERHQLANQLLRFCISSGCHAKAAAFALAVAAADPDASDAQLLTPLHLCVLFRRLDIARLLLLVGADADLRGGVRLGAAALATAEETAASGDSSWSAEESRGLRVADMASSAREQPLAVLLQGGACLHCNRRLVGGRTGHSGRCDDCLGHYCTQPEAHHAGPVSASGSSTSDSGTSGSSGGSSGGGQRCLRRHPCWARMPGARSKCHPETEETAISRSIAIADFLLEESEGEYSTARTEEGFRSDSSTANGGGGASLAAAPQWKESSERGRRRGSFSPGRNAASQLRRPGGGAPLPRQVSPPSRIGERGESGSDAGIGGGSNDVLMLAPQLRTPSPPGRGTQGLATAAALGGDGASSHHHQQQQQQHNRQPSSPWVALFQRRKGLGRTAGNGDANLSLSRSRSASGASPPQADSRPWLGSGSGSSPPPLLPLAFSSAILGNWAVLPRPEVRSDRERLLAAAARFVTANLPGSAWLLLFLAPHLATATPRSPERSRGARDRRRRDSSAAATGPADEADCSMAMAAPEGLGLADAGVSLEGIALALAAGATGDGLRSFTWRVGMGGGPGPDEGVPWQAADDAWCCPVCACLFSVLKLRHHCRGCGLVFCDEHAPMCMVADGAGEVRLCSQCLSELKAAPPAELAKLMLPAQRTSDAKSAVGEAVRFLASAIRKDSREKNAASVPEHEPSAE